ncbi:MAG: ATP-binding protein [Christensenellales bacterium]
MEIQVSGLMAKNLEIAEKRLAERISAIGYERVKAQRDAEKEKMIREMADRFYIDAAKSRLGEKFSGSTFDNFRVNKNNKEAYDACLRFAQGKSNKGIMLAGPIGIGKNHLAAAIVNELAKRGDLAYVSSAKRLQTRLYDSYGHVEDAIDNIFEARVIVINDIGKESGTETSRSLMADFVDQAYEREKKLIITTNMTADEIADGEIKNGVKHGYGLHTLSRLLEMCEVVEYSDYDHRVRGGNQ